MGKTPPIKELREKYTKHDAQGYILRACDYLAVYPAKLLLYTPLTPNQITVLWIFIKIIMAMLLITGNYTVSVIAILLFQLASIIDGSDGIVARYRKHYSLNGKYLDLFGHYFCNSLILITLAVGTYVQAKSIWPLVAAAAAVFSFLLSKSLTVNPAWFNKEEERNKIYDILYRENLSLKNQKNKLVTFVFDILLMDNPLNLMFWGVLLGYSEIVLWIYAVFLFLEMTRKLFLQFWRIYKAEKEERNPMHP